MPPQEIPIPLRSLDSRSDRVRPFGRALSMQNVDIEKANEVKRRKGYIRRLHEQQSGPIRMLFAYPGLCGRVMEYAFGTRFLTIVGAGIPPFYYGYPGGVGPDLGPGEGILGFPIQQQTPFLAPIENFAGTVGSLVLTWEYPGASLEPLTGGSGVIINRRTDAAPISPYDPDATIIYLGSATTFTDTEASEEGINYYAAWAIYPSVGYADPARLTYIIRGDNFNRADGALTDPPYDWWVADSPNIDIYSNRLTVDGDDRGYIYTPQDYYSDITMQADVWHEGLSWITGFMIWRFQLVPTSGSTLSATLNYQKSGDRWYLALSGSTGTLIGNLISGEPPAGTMRLTVIGTTVRLTFSTETVVGTNTVVPATGPFSMRLDIIDTVFFHDIAKRAGFDNVRVAGAGSE